MIGKLGNADLVSLDTLQLLSCLQLIHFVHIMFFSSSLSYELFSASERNLANARGGGASHPLEKDHNESLVRLQFKSGL